MWDQQVIDIVKEWKERIKKLDLAVRIENKDKWEWLKDAIHTYTNQSNGRWSLQFLIEEQIRSLEIEQKIFDRGGKALRLK
jgi:hypothetical protein